MAIGPNSKKISETIKNINVSQQDKNRVTVSKDPNENVSRFINKKLVLPNATTKEAKPYVGTDNINTAASYENLLHRVKATKTKLIAINEAAFDKFSDEDIDSFLSWNLPKLTSVSLVYDYKDKFVTNKKFEKWASNFKFTDDPKNAYEHYDPLIMSTKSTSNKSDYSQYFTETGLAIAEAYKSKVSEVLQEYSANADNILVVSAADLAENPKIINKFIEADNDTKHKVLLSRSKYVLWGNPESIIASKQDKEKKSWDSIAFDGLKVYLEDDKADTFRSEFKSEPTKGFGTFTSNNGEPHIEYVVPESIKFLEYNDEKKDYSLAKTHIGALSAAAVTAANRTLGNLTIQNTTYKSYKTGETGNWELTIYNNGEALGGHAWDYDWGFGTAVGEGFIGDIIYQMYSSREDLLKTSFGHYINSAHRSGLATKSEMDLQTTAAFDLVNGTIDRKIHVATCIGFTMYDRKGRDITGYITSSDETIPASTHHSIFAIGRIAALNKRLKEGSTDLHIYHNNAIMEMILSGPDFMSNMYDVYFVKYNASDNTAFLGEFVDVLSLTTNNSVLTSDNHFPSAADISKGLPATTRSMLKSKYDFVSRVSSVTIPAMEADTIEYSYLGQHYMVPGYRLNHDFSSSLSIEMDADLEYMRTINKIAGFINGTTIGSESQVPSISQRYRLNRIRTGSQKIGILIKLLPGNMFYNPDDNFRRYLIFDDVLFTGGGQVSFSQSVADMVSVDFKFIYKNISMGDFPVASNNVARGEGNTIKHINTGAYAPGIQMKDNINIARDDVWNTIKPVNDKIVNEEVISQNYIRGIR